jgi:hypothetical protein
MSSPILSGHPPTSSNTDVIGRKIYRTRVDSDTFYLIGTIEDNITTEWIDNMTDFTLNTIYEPTMQNIIPNLNSFMSHSTDINYMNSKNMSDMNDYLFNKPYIMMVNGSETNTFNDYNKLVNSFDKDYVYFYNIHFKMNRVISTIMWNNLSRFRFTCNTNRNKKISSRQIQMNLNLFENFCFLNYAEFMHHLRRS